MRTLLAAALLVLTLHSPAQADLVFSFTGTVSSAGLGLAVNDTFTYSFKTIGDPSPTVDFGDVLSWSSIPGASFFTDLTGTNLTAAGSPTVTGLQLGLIRSTGAFNASFIAYDSTATDLSVNGNTLLQLDGRTDLAPPSGLIKSTATGVSLENALNLGTYAVNIPNGIVATKVGGGETFSATLTSLSITSGNVAAVPEPSSMISLSLACIAYAVVRKRRRNLKKPAAGTLVN